MAELLYPNNERAEVVRKQILVLQCSNFLHVDEKEKLLDRVREEMKEGLVFLPPYITAVTVDKDSVVLVDMLPPSSQLRRADNG